MRSPAERRCEDRCTGRRPFDAEVVPTEMAQDRARRVWSPLVVWGRRAYGP